jgi:hypothetical protein
VTVAPVSFTEYLLPSGSWEASVTVTAFSSPAAASNANVARWTAGSWTTWRVAAPATPGTSAVTNSAASDETPTSFATILSPPSVGTKHTHGRFVAACI